MAVVDRGERRALRHLEGLEGHRRILRDLGLQQLVRRAKGQPHIMPAECLAAGVPRDGHCVVLLLLPGEAHDNAQMLLVIASALLSRAQRVLVDERAGHAPLRCIPAEFAEVLRGQPRLQIVGDQLVDELCGRELLRVNLVVIAV
eukprot:7038967-Alexandrium_andersonii.AAC.1